MANQIIVTQSGNVQVSIEPTPNVQVQISRAAIGTVSNVPTANFANYSNLANYATNVISSNQPNITSLGTLTGLNVAGNGTIDNLTVTGNLAVGNLFANNANYANFANVANIANVANSVAVANVNGIGNIATINLDGNVSNVLSGNGSFVALPTVSANANYANFAGEAFNVSGSNVTGTVANANYAVNAGNATIANSANSVALANVSGAGNIASINLDGNVSNVLSGNGSFVALPTVSANANYANFAGTAFNVSGANVSGEVANANYATIAGTAYSVSGSNVVGEVSNANYATYSGTAGVANSVALANVVGAGNIASINLDGNVSNALLGDGSFGPVEVTSTTIANGTSNVNIPVANGNVNISTNGNANIAQFDTNGALFLYPTTSSINGLRINSYGNPVSGDVSRIASYRARGNATTPLSVQPNDNVMRFLGFGYNGAGQQTNSVGSIRATVDSSYTANGANIPIGWHMTVNDTNGGVNNQSKTHNFYSNGNVTFAQGATFGNTSQDTVFKVLGNNNNGYAEINGVSLRVFQDNANSAAGYSPFFFYTYQSNNDPIPGSKYYRAGGTASSPTAVSNGSNIAVNQYAAYADSGNTYKPVFQQEVTITSNDGAGNLTGNMNFYAYKTGSNINLQASNTYADIMRANYFIGDGSNLTNINGSNVSNVANANYAANAGYANTAGNLAGNIANLIVNSGNVALPVTQIQPTGVVVGTSANAILQANSGQFITDYGNGQGDGNLALTKATSFVKLRGDSSTPTAVSQNDKIERENHLAYNGTGNVLAVATQTIVANTNSNANAVWSGGQYQIITGNPNGDTGNANALSNQNLWNFDQWGRLVISPGRAPTGITQGAIAINTYGGSSDSSAQGISWNRYRGNRDSNLSVQPNDYIGRMFFIGYNGTSLNTSRLGAINAIVDSSYVANSANIPIGLNFTVCDNTTSYTHSFYANSAISLAGNLSVGNITSSGGIFASGNITAYNGTLSAGNSVLITLDNNSTQGLLQQTYNSANIQTGGWTSWRKRGNISTPLPVQAGDEISKFNSVVYADSGNTYYQAAEQTATVSSNDLAGNVTTNFRTTVYGNGSRIDMRAPQITFADSNDYGTGNAVIFANGYISTNNEIDYLRTFGSFTSNVTQTNSGANAVNYMTLNNDEGSNGVSIVSSSQITVARTGRYNLQFSAQITHDTNATANIEIWLTKNGSSVANTNSRLTLAKDQPTVAAWNFVDNATTANTYYQIAWASPDTNMEILAYDAANTVANVAIPSIIVTVVPVGA